MNDSRRRKFLKVAGGVAVVGSLAGCAGEAQEDGQGDNQTGDEPANESGQEEPTEEPQDEEPQEEPQDEETQEGTGEDLLRVAHMIPGFPAVDVYVDGSEEPVISDLGYTDVTGYVPLGAGDHQIRVTPAGSPSLTIYDQQVSIPSGNTTAVALPTPDNGGNGQQSGVSTTTGFQLELYGDQNTPPADSISNSRIRVIHAAPDAPPVNVMVGQTTVFENVAFGEAGYYDLPAGDYEFDVVPADAASANGGGTGNTTENESDGGLFSSLAATDGGSGISLLQEEENESAPPEEGEEEGDSGVEPVLTFDATTEPNSVYTVFVTGYVDPEAADSEAELEAVVVQDVADGEVVEAEDE